MIPEDAAWRGKTTAYKPDGTKLQVALESAIRRWPTPAANEAGWRVGGEVDVVDKDGESPAHPNQRFYDKATGRLVQKGLAQVVQMFATPTVNGNHNRAGLSPKSGDGLATQVKRWPAPTARLGDSRGAQGKRFTNPNRSNDLDDAVAWATPTASPWRSGKASAETHQKNSRPLSEQVGRKEAGGQLNPYWVELLMGWPYGWTSLEPCRDEAYFQEASIPGALRLHRQWWQNGTWEAGIPRVARGLENRTRRLKAIGNGQVPQTALFALIELSNLLRGNKTERDQA